MRRWLLIVLAALVLPICARADGPGVEERWYIVEMQGHRAGWMHERVTTDARNITSDSEMKITIKRGELGIAIRVASSFVETGDGKPVRMSSTMQLGAQPAVTEYTFEADGIHVKRPGQPKTTGQAGPEVVPLPEGEWKTPRAAERYMAAQILAGAKSISVRTIDPLSGPKPITSHHTLLERTTLAVIGRDVPAIKWKSTTDAYPGLESTDFTDERGDALRTETSVGGIKLVVLRADRDLALAKIDAPELLVGTLIKPDKPIAGARTLRRAVYTISSTEGKLPDIVSEGAQTFERLSETSGRLTVDLDAVAPTPESEVADSAFTNCSTMISCADPKIGVLVKDALRKAGLDGKSPAGERAEALRAYVSGYINKKSLDVGFASAGEVARTRSGDCSEHAVLLCALLRADKVPARVVSGIVYVDAFAGHEHVFGYHMWAQALLDVDGKPRWTDLDAALSPAHAFDATHIALAPTSLSDDDTANALVRLAPLIGTLKVGVETGAGQ